MYIVRLNPDLLEVNARIAASPAMPRGRSGFSASPIPPTALSGTIHSGYNEVTASIAPGATGTITVSFDVVVPSVTSPAFDLYRTTLTDDLSVATEQGIAEAAGIGTLPPPAPASRMASYVLALFSDVVFDGEVVSDQSRAFTDEECVSSECKRMLTVTRRLEMTQVTFSGTLTASGASADTADVAAYIPITAIEFSDGLTVSFAGYSDNVLVDDSGLTPFDIPGEFWSEPG
jgi:hypothetical protein